MSKKILRSPYELVAKVLEIDEELLNEKSAMGETPNWDSLNHVAIIVEVEKSYGVAIPNDDIEKYVTMKSIIEIYVRKSGNTSLGNRIIESFKRSRVGRIFFK